jgi:hypothetical protein
MPIKVDDIDQIWERRPPFGDNGKLKYLPILCTKVSLKITES